MTRAPLVLHNTAMHDVTQRMGSGRMQALTGAMGEWFTKPRNLFAFFIALAIVLRMATFGHPNSDSDEAFYLLIGQAMHAGALPYVDIWDRKPVGLFVLYYLIVGVSGSVIAYQAAAALFAGATAAVIVRIAAQWTGTRGAVFAGIAYLLLLPIFLGFGGQAPVFYNLFIALAALLLLTALPALRRGEEHGNIYLAMALCGIAMIFKQTTIFECAYFGLVTAAVFWQSPAAKRFWLRIVLLCIVIAALPNFIAAGFYYLEGNWAEYWHAMFTSNLAKKKPNGITIAARLITLYIQILPILLTSALGLLFSQWVGGGRDRFFLKGWIITAVVGFLIVPNFYPHYVLPLLVPMCVASALFFDRKDLGLIAFAIVAGTALWRHDNFAFRYTRMAQAAVGSMAQSIREHDGGRGLLVYDGPVLLYSLSGNRPLSPLALPLHLNYDVELDVSHLRTNDEVARILVREPGAVTMAIRSRNNPPNRTSWRMVSDYVRRNCRLVDMQMSRELFRSDLIAVYGDCNPRRSPLRPPPVPPVPPAPAVT